MDQSRLQALNRSDSLLNTLARVNPKTRTAGLTTVYFDLSGCNCRERERDAFFCCPSLNQVVDKKHLFFIKQYLFSNSALANKSFFC